MRAVSRVPSMNSRGTQERHRWPVHGMGELEESSNLSRNGSLDRAFHRRFQSHGPGSETLWDTSHLGGGLGGYWGRGFIRIATSSRQRAISNRAPNRGFRARGCVVHLTIGPTSQFSPRRECVPS
jgi:hypothetical protein